MYSKPRSAALVAVIMLALAGCGGNPEHAPAPVEKHIESAGPVTGAPHLAPIEPARTRPASSSTDLTHLADQVALLRREVADIRRDMARIPTVQGGAVESALSWRSNADARLEAKSAEQSRIAAAEAAFRTEDIDARWSQQAVVELRAGLAAVSESIRNAVRGVECRGQTCRVEIGSEASELLQQELMPVLGHLSRTLPNAVVGQVDEGNGRQATVLLLSR